MRWGGWTESGQEALGRAPLPAVDLVLKTWSRPFDSSVGKGLIRFDYQCRDVVSARSGSAGGRGTAFGGFPGSRVESTASRLDKEKR